MRNSERRTMPVSYTHLDVYKRQLQNDGFVQKISEYIAKKVADKLTGMCKTERESYEKYWDDISPFIKFGCIKDCLLYTSRCV